MPSIHQQLFGDVWTILVQEHGESVRYTRAATGASSTFDAIAGPEAAQMVEGDLQRSNMRHRPLQVHSSKVALPVRGDTVTIPAVGGDVYTVDAIPSYDAGVYTLIVVRPERIEAGGRRR